MLGEKDRLEKMRRHWEKRFDALAILAAENLARAVQAELRLEAQQRENEKLRVLLPTVQMFGKLGCALEVLKSTLATHLRMYTAKEAADLARFNGIMRLQEDLKATYNNFIARSEALTQRAEGGINAAGPRGAQGAGGTALDAAQVIH